MSEFNCQGKLLDAVEKFIHFEDPWDAASFQACHHGNMEDHCVHCRFYSSRPPECLRRLLKKCAWQLKRNLSGGKEPEGEH